MKDLKESLVIGLIQLGMITALAIALAITAIIEILPWLILAGAAALCLVMWTGTRCYIAIIKARRERSLLPDQNSGDSFIMIEGKSKLIGSRKKRLKSLNR